MSFASILYDIIILPIESIIEFVFCFVLDKFDKFGVAGAIVAVSLAVNFLALPIYNVADDIQIKERELQKKMKRWVTHIKAHFKGDEQFMMLSEYYRQNNYHPLYALRQSLSILIQIPFFMAAYNFLSHCSLLENQSILFLKDLSKPDALISVMGGGVNNSGFTLNLLPILMTAINVVSSIIYTKDAPLREKIQTFALAGIFLVLLYNSPSGLVFYWVLNQVFSLCKNIVKKMKYPGKIVHGFLSAMLVAASGYFMFFSPVTWFIKKLIVYIFTLIFIIAPFVWRKINSKNIVAKIYSLNYQISSSQNFILLVVSCVVLWFLCGLLLPSSAIGTSPSEFSFLGNTSSPLNYIWGAFAFFAGFFVFWPLVIYKMFGDNKAVKYVMPLLFLLLAICSLANAFLFKYDYGAIDVLFSVSDGSLLRNVSPFFSILPLVFVLLVLFIFVVFVKQHKMNIAIFFMVAISAAELTIGIFKINNIEKEFVKIQQIQNEKEARTSVSEMIPEFHFSKTEPNVLVLFLDRGVSTFVPYIFEQFPELNESYDGFVYYPNCLSFGDYTYYASPAMLGGYEYTIDEINARVGKTIKEKHNEATLLLPRIFSDAGYDVTLCKSPYLNYDERPLPKSFDIARIVFDSNTAFNKYIKDILGDYSSSYDIYCHKAIKNFIITEIIYPPLRITFSNNTSYYFCKKETINEGFLREYSELYYLGENFDVVSEKPTYNFIGNEITHCFETLREGYVPGVIDDEHPAAGTGSYQWRYDGVGDNDYQAYQVNAAALLQISRFLNALKIAEIYDNTRIIIMADHGARGIHLPIFEDFSSPLSKDAVFHNPALLFKDFNSHGELATDNSLVTNAEVPYLAVKNLNVSNKNPFTGNPIRTASEFNSFNVYNLASSKASDKPDKNASCFVMEGRRGYNVHTNIFDESNWTKLDVSEVNK